MYFENSPFLFFCIRVETLNCDFIQNCKWNFFFDSFEYVYFSCLQIFRLFCPFFFDQKVFSVLALF